MLKFQSFLGLVHYWLQGRIPTGRRGPSAKIRQEPIDKRFSTVGVPLREALGRSTIRSLTAAFHVEEISRQARGLKKKTEIWRYIFCGGRAAEPVGHSRHSERASLPLPDKLDVDVISFAADGDRAAFEDVDHRSRNIWCVRTWAHGNAGPRRHPRFSLPQIATEDRMSRMAPGRTQCRQAHGRQVGKIT